MCSTCTIETIKSSSEQNDWLEYQAESVSLGLVRGQSVDVEVDGDLVGAACLRLAGLALVLYQVGAEKLLG